MAQSWKLGADITTAVVYSAHISAEARALLMPTWGKRVEGQSTSIAGRPCSTMEWNQEEDG